MRHRPESHIGTLDPPIEIVLSEEYSEEQGMVRQALLELELNTQLTCVGNSEHLFTFLRRHGRDDHNPPMNPTLVLMDMPVFGEEEMQSISRLVSATETIRIPFAILRGDHSRIPKRLNQCGIPVFQKPESFPELVGLLRNLVLISVENQTSQRLLSRPMTPMNQKAS